MNWEVILWSSGTILVTIVVCAIILTFISSKGVKKRGIQVGQMQEELKVGTKILFAGGLVGKITSVKEDTIFVELSKGLIVEASRYSVSSIIQ